MKHALLLAALFLCARLNAISQPVNCKQHFSANTLHRGGDGAVSVASQNFNVTYYRCFWEVTPNVRFINGVVTVKFKMVNNGSNITFDLINGLTVDSVKYQNSNTTFSRPPGGLLVNFGLNLLAGTTDSVTVYYQGAPPATEGYFATGTHSGTPITYTLSEPYGARYWWPCKDDLVDKADSIDVYLKYPAAFTGVANGKLTNEVNDGTNKISQWQHRKPIVAYLVAFAITNYTKNTGTLTSNGSPMPFINYVYPESMTSYNANISKLTTAFNLFEQKFGPYPFNSEQYMQTQMQAGTGGMEHQTNSFIDNWGENLMAHELMHQWFGNKVTCNTWKDIWLNEGFASYSEVLYKEETLGVAARIAEMQNRSVNVNGNNAGSVYRTDTSSVASIFNYRLSYLKGSWVAHMLRWQLGDNAYFQACRNYLNAPGTAYGFATTDSLKKYMEAGLTGGGNLTEFFNDWVYGQGYPAYTIRWNQVGSNVIVKADQVSANTLVSFYEMPIPVRFVGNTRDTIIVLNHNSNGQLFNFPVGFAISSAIFDPESWILSKGNTTLLDQTLTPTSVNNIIQDNSIVLGPIPAVNVLNIYKPANKLFKTIEVYNLLGEQVLRADGNAKQINIGRLPAGRYMMKLINFQNKTVVKSFVK
jgi:aminopeptidase N